VGSTSYKQAQTLASHAQSIGADAIGCLGPMFLKPQTVEDLVLFCAEVASAAPNLPFYYYHLPDISGISLNMFEFLKKISNSLSNFVGIKYTHDDLRVLLQCLQFDEGKWDILHGFDEILMAGLSLGVKGAIGSTYNYLAPLYYEIIEKFNAGDLPGARALQHKSATLIELLFRFGGPVAAGKSIMKMIGLDCGPIRLPARTLSGQELIDFEKELKKIGFFDWPISSK
jgi:N-acetylneuraminate lyase